MGEVNILPELYEAAVRERENEPRRHYLGMSSIGDPCARKLWYDFRGYTPLDTEGKALMIFDIGKRVEEALLHWLKATGYHLDGEQEAYSELGGLFRGHCDGILTLGKDKYILEIKSANARRFKAFKKNGVRAESETYYAQVQCYMGYSGITQAIWLVMCKDNSEIYQEVARFDREYFETTAKKAESIIRAELPPARTKSDACVWCDYRLWCEDPDKQLQTNRVCGTCNYLKAGLPMMCGHKDHAFALSRWGESCKDWSEETDKVPF